MRTKILIKFRDICKMEEYVKNYKHKYVKCMHHRINMMMCNIIAIVNLWIHLSHQMYVIVKFSFLLSLSLSLSLSLARSLSFSLSLSLSLSSLSLCVRACVRTCTGHTHISQMSPLGALLVVRRYGTRQSREKPLSADLFHHTMKCIVTTVRENALRIHG